MTNYRQLEKRSSDGTDCTTWKVQGYLLIVIRVLAGASDPVLNKTRFLLPRLQLPRLQLLVQISARSYIRLT